MSTSPARPSPDGANLHLLLGYVADLELEVDRLRRQGQFVRQEVIGTLKQIRGHCAAAANAGQAANALAPVEESVLRLMTLLRDTQETTGYHPAHDQVVAIAVRPLLEQVFRSQQYLLGASQVALRLELETEHLEWFPVRLRHVLDNLISNSLRYRDPDKSGMWVQVGFRATPDGWEIQVSDNGLGMPASRADQMLELFYRAAPARAAGLGVGLAVVKMLVEQSGGTLTVDSGEGQGTTFVAFLPRYELEDYLCNNALLPTLTGRSDVTQKD